MNKRIIVGYEDCYFGFFHQIGQFEITNDSSHKEILKRVKELLPDQPYSSYYVLDELTEEQIKFLGLKWKDSDEN